VAAARDAERRAHKHERSRVRIVDFRGRKSGRSIRAARDQHAAVDQRRRRRAGPGDRKGATKWCDNARCGIEQLRTIQGHAINRRAADDEHSTIGETRCGVTRAGLTHHGREGR
jgi:hypothetical protein